ncbi:hypothetical protein D1J36_008000 [Riemerella anatipestifer]|uniref:hypothetical protein n=1 Tax=Riemerella anatipestifer TaxID=34085 RepID=UPI0012ADB2C1|nr:hypothetical protein [Riemerella anatipestifer]MDY3522024.1 hypothetical protein [Riemerella anatipestifer]MDY3534289.1 hypothetical protein [Riemerella anatipestifer]MDY3536342.1 hypothetical protein [Riemerella anatipestifer]USL95213.1 hypothetical protein D1J36_008000 [Riemerella anatipestifer]
MAKIQLRSTKELNFPPFHKGYITIDVDLIQNKPKEEKYELRIVDTCTKEVEEEIQVPIYPDNFDHTDFSEENQNKVTFETRKQKVTKILGTPNVRFSIQTYEQTKQLVQLLQSKTQIKQIDLDEAIIEAFRQGLYLITKDEIENKDLKWYGCESINDWEIVRD